MFKNHFNKQNRNGTLVLIAVALVVGVWGVFNNIFPSQLTNLFDKTGGSENV